ncbi:unnamed protein product [Sympodiomycopsis kandeliae]
MTSSAVADNALPPVAATHAPLSPVSAETSRLLFSHPAARLIKSIPPRETPRINGNVPRDLLGPGLPNYATSETTGAILHDWQGSLKLYAVPDRLSHHQTDTAGNLVFSIEHSTTTTPTYGAEARKHLPFRSYGQEASMPKDTIPRPTYLGLGAGSQGGDGGSFWFLEDVSEAGGADRWRWEQEGVGNRAIWTVWLFGAPSPVVNQLRQMLDTFPTMPPSLPPFLKDGNRGAPWHDQFIANVGVATGPAVAVASSTAPSETVDNQLGSPASQAARRPLPPTPPIQGDKTQPVATTASPVDSPAAPPLQVFSDVTNMKQPEQKQDPPGEEASKEKRKLPLPIPPLKPPLLRHLSSTQEPSSALPFTPPVASPLITAHEDPSALPHPSSRRPIVDRNDDKRATVDDINSSIGSVPALNFAPSRTSLLAKEEPVTDTLSPREERGSEVPSEYRHSLVAVDPDTGAVIGVVAHNVFLSEDDGKHTPSMSTSASATPKPSVLRPATTYRDEDALRAPSRRNSVLAGDTFAPPPLPVKAEGTVRDSVDFRSDAENFLSAKEYQTGAEEDNSDEDDEVHAGFTSFDGGKGGTHHIVESHRPDLLVDDEDEGAASDASGSTIGGPAVKLWRKARGGKEGEKKRAAKKAAKQLLKNQDDRRRGNLNVSEASVRTSRAETAREGDDELEEDDEDQEVAPPSVPLKSSRLPSLETRRSPSIDTLATLDAEPETTPAGLLVDSSMESERQRRLHGHIPRADMQTAEIVSTEDNLWREAFDKGQIPVDGAYTHLAASYESTNNREEEEEEDLSLDPAARDAPELKILRKAPYLQGGTVLIEFLAGSKITASVIKPKPSVAQGAGQGDVSNVSQEIPSSSTSAGGLLSLIPALPAHIFGFLLGSSKSDMGGDGETDADRQPEQNEPDPPPSLLSSWTSAITNWSPTSPLSSWFTWLSTSDHSPKATKGEVDDSDSEWEVAIPNFDPNSLASTPRPVYRRKRPAPSFENGFQVREQKEKKEKALINRYSIIHFDGEGIGRRAFIADAGAGGMVSPGLHAGRIGFGAVL